MSENGSKPKFDFTKVSRKWNNELGRSLMQVARMQVVMQRQPHEGMDDEEIEALLDRQEQAIDELETLADTQAALLVQVLVDVPRDWLLPDAPDELDWSQVESLDYIQSRRYGEILEMVRTMNIPEDDAKNLRGQSRSQRKRRGQ